MKNFIIPICLCMVLISCSKSRDVMAPVNSAPSKYTLKFEMAEEEENTVYNIELSKDGINFAIIDTMHVNTARRGIYTYDVSLGHKDLVRVYSVNKAGAKIYSSIVQAN